MCSSDLIYTLSLSHRMAGIDRPAERLRILNGLDQHAQVKPRDRVKIVVD